MEYYEILNEFINNNKIDEKLVPYVIELLEVHRNILFLGEENNNLIESYSKDTIEDIINFRTSFIKSELSKIDVYISELRSLKESNDPDSYVLIDGMIRDKEIFKNKLSIELDNPKKDNVNELKESLEYKHENNKKNILLSFSRLKEIDSIFEKENKVELLSNVNDVITNMLRIYILGIDPTYSNVLNKIEKISSKIDINYLRDLSIDEELNNIVNSKKSIEDKDGALNYLNKLYNFSIKYSKPLSNDGTLLKIASREHKVYSLNLYNYLDRARENPKLTTYYVLLTEQLSILKTDVDSKDKQIKYLKTLDLMLDTIAAINEISKIAKVDNGIFDYNIEKFDEVKIVGVDQNRKIVRYKSGEKSNYSIIENREVLNNELGFWNKKMNDGFNRYDIDFYEDVEETFNFIKFYYKFKSYVMYSEVNNKIYNLEASKLAIEEDKKQLELLAGHIKGRVEAHKAKGLDKWKEERNPEVYFSNHKDKEIILETILPKDGVGRCINTSEMLKSIYGLDYVKGLITTFEEKRGNKL